MVNSQIHTAGVNDERILNAFGEMPREIFMQEKLQPTAYHDGEVELGQGRYLLEPIVHARMIQAARITSVDVVLDVGCATGYSSALLSMMASTVVALESNKKQLDRAIKLWDRLSLCNIVSIEGALSAGVVQHAPFSLIMINGAVASIPRLLSEQLAPQGRLFAVLKKPGFTMGRVIEVYKDEKGHLSQKELFDAAAAYLPEFEPETAFQF